MHPSTGTRAEHKRDSLRAANNNVLVNACLCWFFYVIMTRRACVDNIATVAFQRG
jgi:hypothetical protein